MKSTIVPAQVTTVEDKVTGNLSLQQLVMLTSPIFFGCVVYVVLPPFFQADVYKIAVIVTIFVVFATLAIRIKGKLLVQWIAVLFRYNSRPRFYIYNKNDTYLRSRQDETPTTKVVKKTDEVITEPITREDVAIADKALLEQLMNDPRAKLRFRTNKKGGLDVHIQEVK